jgi:hypothetical protein
MIYWHAEKHAVCIYSRPETCSSSEVTSMNKGVLRYCTQMRISQGHQEWERISHQDRLLLKSLPTEPVAVSHLIGRALLEQARYLFLTPHVSVPAFLLD